MSKGSVVGATRPLWKVQVHVASPISTVQGQQLYNLRLLQFDSKLFPRAEQSSIEVELILIYRR